ncbi:MAG: sensor histidine kinase, partial [Solirubrobacteraceae bacterium]
GLAARLAAAAAEIQELHGIPVRLTVSPAAASVPSLGEPVAGLVDRVAREALLNAAKHAGARRLEASVQVRDGRLLLSVTDDGRGQGASPEGYGLAAIRRAVRRQGGTLTIGPRVPSGTDVVVSLPL